MVSLPVCLPASSLTTDSIPQSHFQLSSIDPFRDKDLEEMLCAAFVIDQSAAGLGKGPAREQCVRSLSCPVTDRVDDNDVGYTVKKSVDALFLSPPEEVVFEDDDCLSLFLCSGFECLPDAFGLHEAETQTVALRHSEGKRCRPCRSCIRPRRYWLLNV